MTKIWAECRGKNGDEMRARSTLTRTSGDKKKPAAPAAGKKRGSRLSFEERRAQILAKAVEFFAEFGLTAQTRSLAEACGVSQRLIYSSEERRVGTECVITCSSRWSPDH